MKKLYTLLTIAFFAVLFTGCGINQNPTKVEIQNAIKIKKTSDKNIYQVTGDIPGITYLERGIPSKLVQIKKIAEFGKSNGFKYFALLDDNFNNVLGLPVTDIETARIICSYRCINEITFTKVIYFKENPNAFPVWSVQKTLNTKIDANKIYITEQSEKNNLKKFLQIHQY